MEELREASPESGQPRSAYKDIICSVAGSTLAWYCFALITMAVEMDTVSDHYMFPATKVKQVKFTWGLLGRFIGAWFFGHIGDRLCLRTAAAASLLLTAITTLAMGFLQRGSSSASMDAWITLRSIQGLGTGGMYSCTMLVAMDTCRTDKSRALVGGTVAAGHGLGLAAAAAASILILPTHTLDYSLDRTWMWKWRAAFSVSVLLIPVAVFTYFNGPRLQQMHQEETRSYDNRAACLEVVILQPMDFLQGVCAMLIEGLGVAIGFEGWSNVMPNQSPSAVVLNTMFLSSTIKAAMTVGGAYMAERCVTPNHLYAAFALAGGAALSLWCYLVVSYGAHPSMLLSYVLLLGPTIGLLESQIPALLYSRFHFTQRCMGIGLVYHTSHLITNGSFHAVCRALFAAGRTIGVHLGPAHGPNVFFFITLCACVGLLSAAAAVGYKAYIPLPIFARSPRVSDHVMPSRTSRGHTSSSSRARSRSQSEMPELVVAEGVSEATRREGHISFASDEANIGV